MVEQMSSELILEPAGRQCISCKKRKTGFAGFFCKECEDVAVKEIQDELDKTIELKSSRKGE